MEDPNKIPEKAKVIRLIENLKSSDLSKVSVQKMGITLTEQFQILPIVERRFLKGQRIVRVRINNPNQIFTSEKNLSYRPDLENIKTYGRASTPLQSVFYGTIVSTFLHDAFDTVLWETSEVFSNIHQETPEEFIFTISYWTVVEDIRTCEIVFCRRFIDSIPYINDVYEKYLDGFKSKLKPEKVEAIGLILSFYSDEFAKTNIKKDTDYLISATYSQLLFDYEKIEGILYPSARVDNHGINIALTPLTVERKLRLDGAAMLRALVNKDKRICTPLKHTTSLGFLNSDFSWQDTPADASMIEKMKSWVMAD